MNENIFNARENKTTGSETAQEQLEHLNITNIPEQNQQNPLGTARNYYELGSRPDPKQDIFPLSLGSIAPSSQTSTFPLAMNLGAARLGFFVVPSGVETTTSYASHRGEFHRDHGKIATLNHHFLRCRLAIFHLQQVRQVC
jgi:hypothetical protein